ncbi:MAG: GTP cyclohydrolase I [Deltaproteobacteria bacterium]|nr:GTP cyclohydrolase I [Deltaproteobacteria bacterium]
MTSRDDKAAKLTKAFEDFLRAVDRSPGTYPELIETPVNAASMWLDEILDGYQWNPKDILAGGSPAISDTGLVIVRDMFFHSTCPHHLLPNHGLAHVGYMPGERIVGLSKIARLVDCFAHRLILQEDMGQLVADALVEHLGAKGAACVLDMEQLCMVIRGVRKPGSRAVTVSYSGAMLQDSSAKMEFLAAINAEE